MHHCPIPTTLVVSTKCLKITAFIYVRILCAFAYYHSIYIWCWSCQPCHLKILRKKRNQNTYQNWIFKWVSNTRYLCIYTCRWRDIHTYTCKYNFKIHQSALAENILSSLTFCDFKWFHINCIASSLSFIIQ